MAQRLDLLKDIAGTKIYDERREESLGIMKETAARRVKCNTMLTDIEVRLKELDAEKEELAKYQALDKRRKARRSPPAAHAAHAARAARAAHDAHAARAAHAG